MVAIDQAEKIVQDRRQITVRSPITGESIGAIEIGTREEVQRAVERARAAQRSWAALEVKARARLIRRWADLLWENREKIQKTIRRETGKNDTGAFIEVILTYNIVEYYAHQAPRLLRPQTRRSLFPLIHRARLYYKPYGVAGFITPWNYPFYLALIDLIPALIAGNTIVLKPSEVAPYSSSFAIELMHQAGIPEDVAQVITGDGSTGAALVDYVDYIAFTGSTATGRKVAVRAAERLIPYSLELGGKDPLIVLKDASLEIAATGTLMAALENAGQACVSTERVYVEAEVYDAFIERIRQNAQKLTVGSGDGFEVHVGSMTNEREVLRTEAHIKDAVAKGAEIIFGGKRRPDLGPLFFEPTVLINVDHTMDVMREETFGPVVPIMKVADANEAIWLANDNQYGLSAAIYTNNLSRGEALATQLDCGDVSVNRPQMVFGTPSLPMGGRKNSGVGRRNGPEGLMRFVVPQSILIDNLLIAQPALTQGDPLTRHAVLAFRKLRRHLPFMRL